MDTALSTAAQSALAGASAFSQVVDLTCRTVSESSARVYYQTFATWGRWAAQHGLDPLQLKAADVLAFIDATDGTKATRQRQLSALRKLAQMLYVLQPTDTNGRILEALKLVKAPAPSAEAQARERTGRALNPTQAEKLLHVWDISKPLHVRNAALVALLLTTGMRRAEAVALRWSDIDLEAGTVTITHGKGDKLRTVAIAGDTAIEALQLWRDVQGGSASAPVFCAVTKGGKIHTARPLSGTDVYRIIQATEKRSGVEFKPHDLRRTFITEALVTGAGIAEVSAQAGHARADTTLRYAQAVDARARRDRLRLRYGA